MITRQHSGSAGQLRSRLAATERRNGPRARAGVDADFEQLLRGFEPIGLAQMHDVALLDRVDTKYLVGAHQLLGALLSLTGHYRVLDVAGVRLNRYQTLYFDTADFALYRHHHAGKRSRCKVRSRQYVDTGQSFLEVKVRTNTERTIKSRIQTPGFVTRLTPEAGDFVRAHLLLDPDSLEPRLWSDFVRVTLVSRHLRERLTLDLSLQFRSAACGVALPGIAIAEVKQEVATPNSEFARQMRSLGIRPLGFSKYCVGIALLYQGVKHNNFKPELLRLGRLMGGD